MKTVAFYTLGCKLNFSETSSISRMFEKGEFKKVAFEEGADIYVINTCSVTENADKKCRKVVREARKLSPDAFVTIIGCYAQLKPREIAGIPGVDAVLGASEKFRLIEILQDFTRGRESKIFAGDVEAATTFVNAHSIGDRTRTFLKVQDGCNYNCSFCTIPLARGSSRSDTIANVVASARKIGSEGQREIVLTGVNLGDFGIRDGRRQDRFIDLARALDDVETIDRFRISSIEPNLLTDEVISFVAGSRRFVPHFHIPLQSGSDSMLRDMLRRYRTKHYTSRISKIKELMPDCCIGVDVIVGFPGETEEEFLTTYNYLNGLPVSYLHVFSYSERAGTPAAEMEGAVPVNERHRRSKMLRILSEKKKRAFYESNAGSVRTVLFENDVKEGMMHGFTENYVRVAAKYDPILINEQMEVALESINEDGHFTVRELERVL